MNVRPFSRLLLDKSTSNFEIRWQSSRAFAVSCILMLVTAIQAQAADKLSLYPAVSSFSPSATTTSLAVSSGGNPVTTVSYGTAITLTATVASSGSAVQPGTVRFCDVAATTLCNANWMLGTAQLRPAGNASITVRLPVGSHSLKAVFLGTKSYAQSQSSASSLTVTGKYPSGTTLASTLGSTTGVYDLTATVFGFGPANAGSPTGNISFQDASDSDSQLATASLSSGTSTQALNLVPVGSITPPNAAGYLTGDFNDDGIPDVVVCDNAGNRVAVFLGKGDGTFGTPAYSPAGNSPGCMLSGDLNNDGKIDLVVTNTGNAVSVLLGNGDGTFQNPQTASVAIGQSMLLTDLNGDGNLDLVVVGDSGLFVYLGNGDGTFQPGVSYQVMGVFSLSIPLVAAVAGDFNADGAIDLAVATRGDYDALYNVAIFLGNGDGTLQCCGLYSVYPNEGQPSDAIAAGDFNHDGNLDLAIANVANGFSGPYQSSVTVMLGNGDGTFQQQVYYALPNGSLPDSIQVADFDGDGKLDVAVPMSSQLLSPPFGNGQAGSEIGILLGNGDGTFQPVAGFIPAPANDLSSSYGLVIADLNGDGRTDILFTESALEPTGQSTQPQLISLLNSGVSTAVTTQGVSITGTSLQSIQASYGGDNLYSASLSNALGLPPIPISPAPITWPAPAGIVYGTSLSATQLDATSTVPGTFAYSPALGTVLGAGIQTLAVTFTPSDATAYSITTSSVQLTVKQAGTSTTLSLTNQNLTLFATVASLTTGTPTGTVTFLSGQTNIGNATLATGIASYTLTAAPSGSATITAEYSGDTNFTQSASPSVPLIGISATSTSLTVPQSGSVSDTLTVTPVFGLSGMLQAACSGLPANSTCTFQPSSVSFSGDGTPATLKLTIQTGTTMAAMFAPAPADGGKWTPLTAVALLFPGCLTGTLLFRRRINLRQGLLIVLLLLGVAGGMTACGGGGMTTSTGSTTNTPAGTSTVQVTLTGTGSLSQTIKLTLNVQ